MKKGDFRRKGFTIIEVSLVIAIAGLIFLMVFVALPALQRSQRDSRRRDDILTFLETVKKYQSNNRGALPTDPTAWKKMRDDYLKNFQDPSGRDYILSAVSCGATIRDELCAGVSTLALNSMDYTLHIFTQATCSGENAVGTSNPRNIAVMYRLEGSGIYCANT